MGGREVGRRGRECGMQGRDGLESEQRQDVAVGGTARTAVGVGSSRPQAN